MGQSELSILGYEDMEEFKSYFDDFADLFVDHPGYISKFKNFSWIDYALHSGAPNRNVLLKHKNGTDIETALKISEIFLAQQINDESAAYCIELGINAPSSDLSVKHSIKLPDEDTTTQEEIKDTAINIDKHHIEENSEMHNFDEILVDDYKENKEETEDIHIKMSDDEINIKQNEEDNIYNNKEIHTEESPAVHFGETEGEHPAKLKVFFDDDDDNTPESKLEISPISEDENTQASDIADTALNDSKEIQEMPDESIDLTQIAEDTGMDLGDIAEFMEDFVKEAESYLEKLNNIEHVKNVDFIKDETIKLKGVASNLKITNITNTLNSILQNTEENKINDLLELLKKQIKNLEEQLF